MTAAKLSPPPFQDALPKINIQWEHNPLFICRGIPQSLREKLYCVNLQSTLLGSRAHLSM